MEGEVFGLDGDEDGAVDDEDVAQDHQGEGQTPRPSAGPSVIHLHFYNNIPSNPVAAAFSPMRHNVNAPFSSKTTPIEQKCAGRKLAPTWHLAERSGRNAQSPTYWNSCRPFQARRYVSHASSIR